MKPWPGRYYPLGATYDGAGTNFSVFSQVAESVELCLIDRQGREMRVDLPENTGYIWHGYLPSVLPGQRYGFRVHGPHRPEAGLRCNPAKLLLDPYARAISGHLHWDPAVFSHCFEDPENSFNETDDAAFVPKSVVVDTAFDWGSDRCPNTAWNNTIIYEVHLKGFTIRNPDIPEKLRGTYSGMAHPAVIDYLKRLGITAVEFLPLQQFLHESHLVQKRLRDYWGYNSIGFFAPHNEYSSTGDSGGQVVEFKQMVKAFHAAGIEVILDVVYNHTAEGNHLGPTLCFKGLDNPAYYRLTDDDSRHYRDYTGTGNTLNTRHPHVLQLIMDSLRYWASEMHVDGFRFDLASTLAREVHAVDQLSSFLDIIQQDPVISQTKLIAEPWDIGEGGYQVGKFPPLWSEWNGRYRDCLRDYWRGKPRMMGEFASRLTGSSDLYENTGRKPYASINFVTAHDGFTLRDLVSFERKHNEANSENNCDGDNCNRSWNCGVEGPTSDRAINELRARQQRNFLATLFLSQGVPMLLGGDEIGRTQRGNNNAYCQDNATSWFDWEHADNELLQFTTSLIKLYRRHPVFRRRRWFQGRPIHGSDIRDIGWFRPDGKEMSGEDWKDAFAKALGVCLNGDAIPSVNAVGDPIVDRSFFIAFNPGRVPEDFTLPNQNWGESWRKILDTSLTACDQRKTYQAGEKVWAEAHSLLLFRRVRRSHTPTPNGDGTR